MHAKWPVAEEIKANPTAIGWGGSVVQFVDGFVAVCDRCMQLTGVLTASELLAVAKTKYSKCEQTAM